MKRPSFRSLISDIKAQPDWRSLADRCCAYYDHEQLTDEQVDQLQALGMPDVVENLIHAPVDSVLGHETQSRRDWLVVADDEDSEEVAEGLNAKLNETLRLCEANSRCSEAYASQIKAGVGWLHVKRNDDPFGTPYTIEHVHRDEIYWDIRGKNQDLSDMRWLARRRFLDTDEAKALLPTQHHYLVDILGNGWRNDQETWEFAEEATAQGIDVSKRHAEWDSSTKHIEFIMDTQRKRVAIYEVYYRALVPVQIIRLPDGRVEELDKQNKEHFAAVISRQARVSTHKIKRMRRCWYLGCHLIADEPSPYPHQHFPYIPFYGYREDKTNIPYGVIRGMIDPQDVYNNTNIRIQHILNTKRVLVQDGSLPDNMTIDDLVHEANRKDGVIIYKQGGQVVVEQDWQELHRLIDIRNGAEQKIRDIAGIFNEFSGKGASGQSGVAISSLAELGAITLAAINNNYEYARKKLAELVLAYIVKDIGNRPEEVAVTAGLSQTKKRIRLNDTSPNTGLNNAVTRAKYQIALASIHSSAGHIQNQHMRLMEMYQTSPDNVKMLLLPMIIETSRMPRKDEVLKKLNEQLGVTDDPEAQAQQQQAAAQQAAQEQALVQAEREAEIALKQAQTKERLAEAEHQQAKAAEVISTIEATRQQREEEERAIKQQLIDQTRQQIAPANT